MSAREKGFLSWCLDEAGGKRERGGGRPSEARMQDTGDEEGERRESDSGLTPSVVVGVTDEVCRGTVQFL